MDSVRQAQDDAGPSGDLRGYRSLPRSFRAGKRARPAGAQGIARRGVAGQPPAAGNIAADGRGGRRRGGARAGAERAVRGLTKLQVRGANRTVRRVAGTVGQEKDKKIGSSALISAWFGATLRRRGSDRRAQ